MSQETEKTISEIINICGGARHISNELALTESAVAKWRVNGIHDRYWSRLLPLSEFLLSETDIFTANEQIRNTAA